MRLKTAHLNRIKLSTTIILWIHLRCFLTDSIRICRDKVVLAGQNGTIINPDENYDGTTYCFLTMSGIQPHSWFGLYVEEFNSGYCKVRRPFSFVALKDLNGRVCGAQPTNQYHYLPDGGPVNVIFYSFDFQHSLHHFRLTYRVADVLARTPVSLHEVDATGQELGYIVSHPTYLGGSSYSANTTAVLKLYGLRSEEMWIRMIDYELDDNCDDYLDVGDLNSHSNTLVKICGRNITSGRMVINATNKEVSFRLVTNHVDQYRGFLLEYKVSKERTTAVTVTQASTNTGSETHSTTESKAHSTTESKAHSITGSEAHSTTGSKEHSITGGKTTTGATATRTVFYFGGNVVGYFVIAVAVMVITVALGSVAVLVILKNLKPKTRIQELQKVVKIRRVRLTDVATTIDGTTAEGMKGQISITEGQAAPQGKNLPTTDSSLHLLHHKDARRPVRIKTSKRMNKNADIV